MKKQVCFFIVLFGFKFTFSSLVNLDVLVKQENVKAIEKILDDPLAKLSYQDSDGNSLLMVSIHNKWFNIAQSLIDKKIEINHQNRLGDTALSFAVLDGNLDLVKKLIDAGVDQQKENNLGRKAVTLAAILLRDERINLDQNKKQKYQEIHDLLKESSCSCVIA